MSEQALLKYKNAFLNKTEVVENAFTSTSRGTDVINHFQNLAKKEDEIDIIMYFNAKGKNAIDVDEISRYGKNFIQSGEKLQDEVLFMAGSKFNVIGFEEKISSQGQRYVEIILNEIN